MVFEVKTPIPPLPDLENPLIRRQEFETLNKNYFYSETSYQLFKDLEL
jgi:hypothetical protein